MKYQSLQRSTFSRRGQAAFTMVEIAIALAVIAFALVAIIGVLPLGLNVQRENREETIVNQDATYFIEAIRTGARGLDDLTNYVLYISNSIQHFTVTSTFTNADGTRVDNLFTFGGAVINGVSNQEPRLTNGARIIGLLSTPQYVYDNTGFESNYVVAGFRSLSGTAIEKFPQKDDNLLNLAFAYRITPELSPVPRPDTNSLQMRTYDTNLHELRLSFRWPLLPNGSIGSGRQTFRTVVGGRFFVTNEIGPGVFGRNLNYLQPSTYSQAQ